MLSYVDSYLTKSDATPINSLKSFKILYVSLSISLFFIMLSGKNVALPNLFTFKKLIAYLAQNSSSHTIKLEDDESAVDIAVVYSLSVSIKAPITL